MTANSMVIMQVLLGPVGVRPTNQQALMEIARQRRALNRRVLASLPSAEDWPLISREMFAQPANAIVVDDLHTDVVPFGNSYKGVEHEWQQWLARFESILQKMFWVSATVHLETELNGVHTLDSDPNMKGRSALDPWGRLVGGSSGKFAHGRF